MSSNYLLVFPYKVQSQDEFESIIDRFDEQDYIVHIFNDISPDSFDLDLLPAIIQEVIKDDVEKKKRIVVCSNVREIIFSWYRCYNHLVHDFIYIIDELDSDLLVSKKEFGFYQQLFDFAGIQNEETEGEIYININQENFNKVFPFIFKNYNFKYFQRLEFFKFGLIPKRSKIQKEYIFEGVKYSFEKSNPNSPVSQVNLESKTPKVQKNEEFFPSLINYPYFLFIYLQELLRKKHPNTSATAMYCFEVLRNKENGVKKDALKDLLEYIKEVNTAEKIFFLSLLAKLGVKSTLVSDEFMKTLLADENLIKYHYPIIYNILFYNSRNLMENSEDYYLANRREIIKIAGYINQDLKEPFSIKLNPNKKKIAFLVDQLLSLRHSPTKVTLDYVLYISKHYPEYEIQVFIEDNFISCPSEIIMPFYYHSVESKKYKDEHLKFLQGFPVNIEYSDPTQSKAQRVRSMVRRICRFDPGVIITTSDISLTRETLYRYYPIIFFSMGGFNFSTLADIYLQINIKEAISFYKRFPTIDSESIYEFKYGLELPEAYRKITRKEYRLNKGDFVLITVGNRLDAELDEDFLEKTCRFLREKEDFKWLIVGQAELKLLTLKYDDLLDEKIIRVDYERDLMALYNICDAYLNPRRHGGGISIAMAMKQGLPIVIFSDQSDGIVYVGEENAAGYDINSYLNEIERLYTDPLYKTKKGSLMKERISTFSMDYSVKNLFEIINAAQKRYHCRADRTFHEVNSE